MNTVIVATDFSKVAENAVEYAAALTKQFGARLVLFNAFSLPLHASNSLLPASSIQKMLDETQHLLTIKADTLAKQYDIQTAYELSYSFLEDEVIKLVDKYEAGLMVFGMATKTFDQDLLGNNTTMAIKKMKFPVLAVPIGARFEGLKNVLFACDVPQGVPAKILAHIKDLAKGLNSNVEVFYVDKTIEELKAEHKGIVSENSVSDGLDGITYSHKSVHSTTVIHEIEKEVIAFDADLLIMIPKKYGFWASLVHRSKTRMMASGLNIPLLTIPL